MERELEFEDDNIRSWKLERDARLERDPTTMDVDLEREEIFESRTYTVRGDALAALALAVAMQHPEIELDDFVSAGLEGRDATMKLLAKQDRSDKRITSILVGTFNGERTVLERWNGLDEPSFRSRVDELDDTLVTRGPFEPPLVVSIEQWRAYGPPFRSEPGA